MPVPWDIGPVFLTPLRSSHKHDNTPYDLLADQLNVIHFFKNLKYIQAVGLPQNQFLILTPLLTFISYRRLSK